MIHPQPKPEPRKRTQARKARTEAAVVQAVRAACVLRDGYCRLDWGNRVRGKTIADGIPLGWCIGPSEWTHLPPHTRAHTGGLPPEKRHSTAWTIQACQRHHDQIDGRRKPKLLITPLTPDGADGPIEVSVK